MSPGRGLVPDGPAEVRGGFLGRTSPYLAPPVVGDLLELLPALGRGWGLVSRAWVMLSLRPKASPRGSNSDTSFL